MDALIWAAIGVAVLLMIVVVVRAARVRRAPPADAGSVERSELDRLNRERRLEREAEDPGPPIGGAGM